MLHTQGLPLFLFHNSVHPPFVHIKKPESGGPFLNVNEIVAHPGSLLFSLAAHSSTHGQPSVSPSLLSTVPSQVNYDALWCSLQWGAISALTLLSSWLAWICWEPSFRLHNVWLSSTKDRFIFVLANLGLVPMPLVVIRRSFRYWSTGKYVCSLMICIIYKAGEWIRYIAGNLQPAFPCGFKTLILPWVFYPYLLKYMPGVCCA